MEGEGASFPRPYFRCKHKCLFPHIRSHPLHTIKIHGLAALSQQPPIMRESRGTGAHGRYSKTLFLRRILDRGLRLNLSLISPHLQTSPPHMYLLRYLLYVHSVRSQYPSPSVPFFRARRYVMRKGRKRRPFPPSGVRRCARGIGSILYTYREDGERRGRIWHIKRRRQVKGEGRGRNGSLGSWTRRRRKGPSPTLHYTRRGECPKGEHGRME